MGEDYTSEKWRFVCTKETPWDGQPLPGKSIAHRDVEEIGEQEDGWPSGDIVANRCKNCGHIWRSELPQ